MNLLLKRKFKRLIANYLSDKGYVIAKKKAYNEADQMQAFELQKYVFSKLREDEEIIIFDVGANRGQTIEKYKQLFPNAKIWSFEPVQEFYIDAKKVAGEFSDVFCMNLAVGGEKGFVEFHESVGGQSSSVLCPNIEELDPFFNRGDFVTHRKYLVPVTTMDSFVDENALDSIQILKLDVEGFELQVLKGAEALLKSGKVELVYSEIAFSRYWNGAVLFHELSSFLAGMGYELFGLYNLSHGALGVNKAGDAIFMRKELKDEVLQSALLAKS